VPQVVAALPAHVRPLVERVHLVDAHAAEPAVLRLQDVEQRHRLAVGHRHHDVGLPRDMVEHGLGR
jgi:hypothetical protein